jgi:hypothetical protein
MPSPVYRITALLSTLLHRVPVGTNLALFQLLWTLISGRLLESRGALFPALTASGLAPDAVRRAWVALAYGQWNIQHLLTTWQQQVRSEGHWQPHIQAGYRPVACDLVGFFRPRLRDCPGKHFSAQAGKALPAISLGMVARVGSVASQRVPLPCLLVRRDRDDPSEAVLQQRLLERAGALLSPEEVLIADSGFPLSQVQAAGVPRFLVRGPKNFTARRAFLPTYKGRGRPPMYGEIVRPLPRQRKEQVIPATPPDREESWVEDDRILRACFWDNLVESSGQPGDSSFTCVVIVDPRYREPLLLLTNLPLSGRQGRALYPERWPVEQLPLAAKQLLGAARQFVFAPESRQRLPELALLAGAILTYTAATQPAVASGFWDRRPQPTGGRLRRVLGRTPFAELGPIPGQLRKKASVTVHLPKGVLGHRRRKRPNAIEDTECLAA